LREFRDRFIIEDGLIYLDGNSLGRLPKETIERTRDLVEHQWARELVLGWEHWIDQGVEIGNRLAPLIGASEGEVVVCDQTSVNLYKVASGAMAATGRPNIVTDVGNFPSDRYILGSLARSNGGELILVPEDPTPDDVANAVDDSVGVVSFSHVSYRSGAMLDAAAITSIAQDQGAFIIWDLAHSAGSVPVDLNGWNADLAVGCTYKYLNGGPGSPGYLYVRSDLIEELDQPMTGWFSHARQFAMADTYEPSASIRKFTVGTPPMASLVGAGVGIDLTSEAGIEKIRSKSIELTEAFLAGIASMPDHGFGIVTPTDPQRRGSHVTLSHDEALRISKALRAHRVIPDFRAPNLIRFGFAPLYTTFGEIDEALAIIASVMDGRAYLATPHTSDRVT
jgi:kynureninase